MGLQNRGQLAHFLGDKGATSYVRLAKGISELSSSLNAQKKEVTYIDDSTDTVTTSYQRSWTVNADLYTENAANELLFDKAYQQAKGDDAVVEMLVAKLWEPSDNNPTTVFAGYKQVCSWSPDNDGGGAGGESVAYSGTLDAKGDPSYGWVTITKTEGLPDTAVFSTTEPQAT